MNEKNDDFNFEFCEASGGIVSIFVDSHEELKFVAASGLGYYYITTAQEPGDLKVLTCNQDGECYVSVDGRLVFDIEPELFDGIKSDLEKHFNVIDASDFDGENRYSPDFASQCDVCGSSPCVDVVTPNGKIKHRFELCGPCCFGTAKALDSDTWNTGDY